MRQKDKQLLLKDLCARLPYGVICQVTFDEDNIFTETLESVNMKYIDQISTSGSACGVEYIKPYLRPMSSMTEEEKAEYRNIVPGVEWNYGIKFPTTNKMDWLNANHFDYRGLIEKGLAIEVTKDNNPYKE